jgi:DNA-3-methyladenine glycosylase II
MTPTMSRLQASRLIEHEEALDHALAALLEANPALQALYTIGGRPPLRKRAPGFKGLAALIVSQQVSTASAAANNTATSASANTSAGTSAGVSAVASV